VRPYRAAVGPKKIGVLLTNGPQADGSTVIVSVDGSTAVTGMFALEYAVFRTLAWLMNGAPDCMVSG
jgi:hypothetical protein